MIKRGTGVGAALLAVLLSGVLAASASGAGSPDGCTSFGLNVSLGSPITVLRNGDQINFTASVTNNAAGACDITDTTIKLQLPGADGNLSGPITLASHQDYLGGSGTVALPTTPYTVNVEENVLKSPVKISFEGTGHYPGGDSPASGSLESHIFVVHPHVTLTVTPNPASGPTPLSTTYTYSAHNDSTFDTFNPSPSIQSNMTGPGGTGSPVLTDDTCSPITFTGGDTNSNETLDQGETWTYSCTHLFDVGGLFADHATLEGQSTRDGRPWPTTTATSTVTVAGPVVAAAPSSKDFGGVLVGSSSAAQTFVISNASTEVPLAIGAGGVSVGGADAAMFKVGGDTCSGQTIAPGASCSVGVAFSPTSFGTRRAALRLSDNAADTPQLIALSGLGTLPPPVVTVQGPKKTHGLRPVFRFSADQAGTTFSCRVDKRKAQPCASPYKLPNVGRGKHSLSVQGTGPSGEVSNPVSKTYRVLKKKPRRR